MDTRTAHEAFSSSSSSSSSSSKCWMHDVFLSFRGDDTRKGFTDHLYMTLEEAGINTFIDNQLRRGEEITAELVQAIQGSRISVIVFSMRYADSSWCLEELVKIMECKRTFGQIVLPIFYDVDPSDVRKQTGIFAQAFQKHEKRFQKDTDHKVERWRAALTEASNLSGWDLRNALDGHEAKFIRKIVKEITGLLNTTYLDVSDYQVGIDSRVQAVAECLGIGLNDVRIIGIWGMGGIGKTTVAKAIYNKFYDRFDGKSFLEKVGEKQLVDLQKQLLYDILKPTKIKVSSVAEGINLIGKRLGSLKVLVIIDDIDSAEQLGALAIKRDTFGEGSRIIITTRDEHFLNTLRVDKIYRVQPMKEEEALELLSWHAFKNPSPNQGYFELAREVVDYCGGLPLALQVLGSFLFTRSTREWESSLVKLKKIPPAEIQKKLKISYDGLSDDYEREIFLDISCFFIGMDKNYVTQILDGCGFSAEIGITVLIERCLVKVNERNKLIVHDLLRDMGRELERAKSPKYPGERCRLWHLEDVKDVLTTKYGTEAIEGLSLNLRSPSPEETSFSTEAFTNMKRLRLLKLNYVQLTGGYEYLFKNLSKNLRWLCCHGFPLEFIPEDFYQPNLVAIDMRYSSLRQVVSKDSKLLEKLKILNLSHSHYLTRSPDFSKLPNLEKLIFKDCRSLSQVHKSIGDLKSLVLVNFKDCEMLKCLPRSFYKLKSIQNLVLNGCSRFKILAEDLGNMVSLTTILANKTAIRKVPSSIVRLKKLEYLSLCDLKSPLQLPPSLGGLYSLRKSSLRDCNLEAIPKDLGSLSCLESLDLDKNNFHCLPNLSALSNLKSLSLNNCNLTDHAIASMDLGCISSLEDLHLADNDFHTLPSLNGLSKLGCLLLNGCENLSKITELPACLDILQANDCTALERMPNISEMSSSLSIDNCPKIIEIPGLNSALNLGMDLHMQGHKNITDIVLKDSMLQGWTGYGQIFLTGNDIPKWFQHVKEGAEVDFEVPLEIGCNLQALAVCMVYSNSHVNHLCDRTSFDDWPASIYVINHTKRTGYAARILSCYIRASHEDCLWLGHLSNTEFDLEGGDFVHVIADIENYNLRVKKIGVRLVCDKIVNFGDFSFIEYRPIAYSEVIKDFSIDVDDDDNEDEDDDDYYDDDDDDNDNDEEEEETPPKRLRFN